MLAGLPAHAEAAKPILLAWIAEQLPPDLALLVEACRKAKLAEARPWLVDLLHWGNPLTPAIETYRTPLYAGEVPPAADAIYLCVAALVALALGALVFSSVDDRIASEA